MAEEIALKYIDTYGGLIDKYNNLACELVSIVKNKEYNDSIKKFKNESVKDICDTISRTVDHHMILVDFSNKFIKLTYPELSGEFSSYLDDKLEAIIKEELFSKLFVDTNTLRTKSNSCSTLANPEEVDKFLSFQNRLENYFVEIDTKLRDQRAVSDLIIRYNSIMSAINKKSSADYNLLRLLGSYMADIENYVIDCEYESSLQPKIDHILYTHEKKDELLPLLNDTCDQLYSFYSRNAPFRRPVAPDSMYI